MCLHCAIKEKSRAWAMARREASHEVVKEFLSSKHTKVEVWTKDLDLQGAPANLIKEFIKDYFCDLNLEKHFLNKISEGQIMEIDYFNIQHGKFLLSHEVHHEQS